MSKIHLPKEDKKKQTDYKVTKNIPSYKIGKHT